MHRLHALDFCLGLPQLLAGTAGLTFRQRSTPAFRLLRTVFPCIEQKLAHARVSARLVTARVAANLSFGCGLSLAFDLPDLAPRCS